jgi:hypothetical protein
MVRDSSRYLGSLITGSVGVRGSSPLSSTSISGGCRPLATRGRPFGLKLAHHRIYGSVPDEHERAAIVLMSLLPVARASR